MKTLKEHLGTPGRSVFSDSVATKLPRVESKPRLTIALIVGILLGAIAINVVPEVQADESSYSRLIRAEERQAAALEQIVRELRDINRKMK